MLSIEDEKEIRALVEAGAGEMSMQEELGG